MLANLGIHRLIIEGVQIELPDGLGGVRGLSTFRSLTSPSRAATRFWRSTSSQWWRALSNGGRT